MKRLTLDITHYRGIKIQTCEIVNESTGEAKPYLEIRFWQKGHLLRTIWTTKDRSLQRIGEELELMKVI